MSAQQPVRLRVFSLNCWGIRFLSRHCAQRYEMIGELLDGERHDIALLQEVWSERDFLFLKRKLASSYPHTHYFRSGVIGSGLAVFSKHKVQDALLYRYSLNGYPYMIHQGDWFGGKAVGMVIVDVSGLRVHVYVTHLHAEYSRAEDDYLPHRIVQAWELLHFVRHTSVCADLVVLGGDLNMHPQDLGNRLLRAHTGLRDCYTETGVFDGCEDGITLIADNSFTKKKDLVPFEKGIRIDYILIKGSERVRVRCESMSTTKGSVPGKPFPYSDHEALATELLVLQAEVKGRSTEEEHGHSTAGATLPELVSVVTEARAVVQVGRRRAERMQLMATRLLAAGLASLLLLLAMAAVPWHSFPYAPLSLLGTACISLLVAGQVLYFLFAAQVKALLEAEDQMGLVAADLQERAAECQARLVPGPSDGSPPSQQPSPLDHEE